MNTKTGLNQQKKSKNKHIKNKLQTGKTMFPFYDKNKVVPLTKTYWFTQWLCDASSRLLWFSFQIPKSNSSFTLFLCGGNSPRGTYMFTKLPTVFNIHKSTLHLYLINKQKAQKKKTNTNKKNPYLHTEVCNQKKMNQHGDFFLNFKSQCSVTKHIIPLIKLTYYTYEWYCLKTLESQLFEVQSQQGRLWDTWNYKYTLDNPHDFHGITHCDYMNV